MSILFMIIICKHIFNILDPSPELSLSVAWSGLGDGAAFSVVSVSFEVSLVSAGLPFGTTSLRSVFGEDLGEMFT